MLLALGILGGRSTMLQPPVNIPPEVIERQHQGSGGRRSPWLRELLHQLYIYEHRSQNPSWFSFPGLPHRGIV